MEDPIVAFARDFSGNDEAIVAEVQAHLADPPTDLETVGFYGASDYTARTRLFLATVSLLCNRGKLYSVEDKYTQELLLRWRDEGLIDSAALPPAAKAVFGPILGPTFWSRMRMLVRAYRRTAWKFYAKATEELEQHIAARGRAVLSIDATDGDTLFFALVDPDVAARWSGKALSEEGGYYAGVRPPMWDRFWDHLAYGIHLEYSKIEVLVSEGRPGCPPGTRMRVPILPLAE